MLLKKKKNMSGVSVAEEQLKMKGLQNPPKKKPVNGVLRVAHTRIILNVSAPSPRLEW